jgi:excisionase family DNA binding protein
MIDRMMTTTTKRPDRATYSVSEAAALLGVSLGTAYKAVRSGSLPVIQVGGRYLIPREALDRLLAGESGPTYGASP